MVLLVDRRACFPEDLYPRRDNPEIENGTPDEGRKYDEEKEVATDAADPAAGSDPSGPWYPHHQG